MHSGLGRSVFFSQGDSGESLPGRGLTPNAVQANPAFNDYVARYRSVSSRLGLNVISENGRPVFDNVPIENLRSYFDKQLENVETSLGKPIKNLILGISGDLDSACALVMIADSLARLERFDIKINLFHAATFPQPSRDERISSLVGDLKERYPNLNIVLSNHNISGVITELEKSLGDVILRGRNLPGAIHDVINFLRNHYRRSLNGACVVGSVESTEIFLGNVTQSELNVLWDPIFYLPKPIIESAFRETCKFRTGGVFDRRWEWPIKNPTSFHPWVRVSYQDDLPVLHASNENPFSPLVFDPSNSSLASCTDVGSLFLESDHFETCQIPGRIQWIGAPVCHIIVEQFESFLRHPKEVLDGIVDRFPHYESDIRLTALLFCEARRLMGKDQALSQLASSGLNSIMACD